MSALFSFLQAFITEKAHAQTISDAAEAVANGLLSFGGFADIIALLRDQLFLVLVPLGVLIVVVAGIQLIISEDEGSLDKAKKTITAVCISLLLAYNAQLILDVFYSPGGNFNLAPAINRVEQILVGFLIMAGILAFLMIVVAGLQVVGSFGKQDTGKTGRALGASATGLAILALGGVIMATIGADGNPSPDPIIERGVSIVTTLLQYVTTIALAVVVYAGILMVFNMGNDEQYTKAKTLITRVLIGTAIILLSGLLVRFVIGLF